MLPKHASQAYCLMLMNVVVASAQLLTTAQAIASEEIGVPRGKKSERYRSTPHYRCPLKIARARFEKASEEIGVPRGKKSERYRSTPHYRCPLKIARARFEKASEEIGVPRGKKSERYRSTAHRQTDRRQFIQVQSFSLPMVGPPEFKSWKLEPTHDRRFRGCVRAAPYHFLARAGRPTRRQGTQHPWPCPPLCRCLQPKPSSPHPPRACVCTHPHSLPSRTGLRGHRGTCGGSGAL